MAQKLFTKAQYDRLLKNGQKSAEAIAIDGNTPDHVPVVKLFNPVGAATWLLSELDPENPDIAFGLCDLGMGSPELGYVSISEIMSVRLPLGLHIERDQWFDAEGKPMSWFAEDARAKGRITA